MHSGLLVTWLLLSWAEPPAPSPPVIEQWSQWQNSFVASGQPARNPSNVEFWLQMTAPSGMKFKVLGFWDGDQTWRVRFVPTEKGTWKFTTRSKPETEGLDGHSGSFACRGQTSLPTSPLRPGTLRVASSGTYFETSDGRPFFWLGDTVWNGPLLAKESDWDAFLADRVEKRFSVIQFNLLAPWRTADTDELGQVAYTGRDDIQINPTFFQRMDRRISRIQAHNLFAAPVLLWTLGKQEISPGQLPDDQCLKLARYCVARYQAEPVCWILAGDENYAGERGPRWANIGRAVFGDIPHAPVTIHPQGMNWTPEKLRGETWLDFLGYQSGHGDDGRTLAWIHSGPVASSWQNKPLKPILNLEPPYEQHLAYQSRKPHGDDSVRRACYWSLLATPVAGLTYGGHGIWSWQTTAGPPKDHERTGIAQPWQVAKDLPGAGQMRHLVELFLSLRWTELRPAQELLTRQPGGNDPARFVAASRTADGKQALLYLPVGGDVALKTELLAANLVAEWFDPRTGKRSEAKAIGTGVYSAPDGKDWLLVLGGKS